MFLIFALLPRANGTPDFGKQRLLSHFSTSTALTSAKRQARRPAFRASDLLSRSARVGDDSSTLQPDSQLRDPEKRAREDRTESSDHLRRCLGETGLGGVEPSNDLPKHSYGGKHRY